MTKVAIYARESSDDITKAPPIAEQIERGKAWAAEQGHEVMFIYQDNGFSGGDWKRPAWNQSVNDAKRHAWQVLWAWNQDRLARDTEQFLWYYRNLTEAKARIWEDTSNSFIDMSDLGGRVKHQTLAQAAEIYRLVTSDKVKRAYQRKKAKGEVWGRPAKSFNLDRAIAFRAKGMGWREIAEQLNAEQSDTKKRVSYQTVRRYLIGLNCNTRQKGEITTQK